MLNKEVGLNEGKLLGELRYKKIMKDNYFLMRGYSFRLHRRKGGGKRGASL